MKKIFYDETRCVGKDMGYIFSTCTWLALRGRGRPRSDPEEGNGEVMPYIDSVNLGDSNAPSLTQKSSLDRKIHDIIFYPKKVKFCDFWEKSVFFHNGKPNINWDFFEKIEIEQFSNRCNFRSRPDFLTRVPSLESPESLESICGLSSPFYTLGVDPAPEKQKKRPFFGVTAPGVDPGGASGGAPAPEKKCT